MTLNIVLKKALARRKNEVEVKRASSRSRIADARRRLNGKK